MLIKTGDGKIIGVVKSDDDSVDDKKTRKALDSVLLDSENLKKNSNNSESTSEADNK